MTMKSNFNEELHNIVLGLIVILMVSISCWACYNYVVAPGIGTPKIGILPTYGVIFLLLMIRKLIVNGFNL